MLVPLRPDLKGSFKANEIKSLLNKKTKKKINAGECIKKNYVL